MRCISGVCGCVGLWVTFPSRLLLSTAAICFLFSSFIEDKIDYTYSYVDKDSYGYLSFFIFLFLYKSKNYG